MRLIISGFHSKYSTRFDVKNASFLFDSIGSAELHFLLREKYFVISSSTSSDYLKCPRAQYVMQ